MKNSEQDRVNYTWDKVVRDLMGQNIKIPKNTSSLINATKKLELGTPISRQKHSYSNDDLEKLRIILNLWFEIDYYCNLSASHKKTIDFIQEQISRAVIYDETVKLSAIFCPSYKTGIGKFGYKSEIGPNTIKSIEQVFEIAQIFKIYEINLNLKIFFSDLLLENLDTLKKKCDYRKQLKLNYFSFKKYIEHKRKHIGNVSVYKLSEINECKENIGEKGLTTSIDLNNPLHKRVFQRNKVFYKYAFGWNDKKVAERTKIIIGSYNKLSEIFREKYNIHIMLWTENLIERGSIYEESDNFIPVLYPGKKNRIRSFFNSYDVQIDLVNEYGSDFEEFVVSLYENEKDVIFEHNPFHIWAYLGFKYKIFKVESRVFRGILLHNKNEVIFFTPVLHNKHLFKKMLLDCKKRLPTFKIRIQNVSEGWVKKNQFITEGFELKSRSEKEVIYDLDIVTKLKGRQFANLRNLRNKNDSNSLITFRSASCEDCEVIGGFVDRWTLLQGYKYKKDKKNNEKYIYCEASKLSSNNSNIDFILGFVGKNLVSVCLVLIYDKQCAVSYSIKGINVEDFGGIKNSTDSTYLYAFNKYKKIGISYMNDGDIGIEKGSVQHKKKFKPQAFISSFDIIIQ